MQIQHILDAYAESEPRRSRGGIYAMAGFDFQAQVAIARFVQFMTATDGLNESGKVFVEALSDVAEVTANKGLVLLQVKRTLSRASLDDAAAEMAAIEAVASQQQPPVNPTYGVVCQYAEIELDWCNLPSKSPQQALVKRLLAEGRLKQPEQHEDPRWAAIATSWSVLKDPWAFYRFAFERVLRRTVDLQDAERCRNEISERFIQDRQHPATPGQLLLARDFEIRSDKADGRLDIGQQVTLKRWQAGQYMSRPALAAGLISTADLLRQKTLANPGSAMPVLWLAGRSGAGKSVMLLNLMSELVRQGARVWWLKPEELNNAIDLLTRGDTRPMPDYLAVDDVFDRDARDSLDIGRISILMDEQGVRDWPVLLTCGPSEFAADFEEATRYQGFELHQHVLPLLDAQEGQQLVDWLQRRGAQLNDPSEALLQTEHGEGLFVSVATELAYGDLRQFGARFAKRVKAHGDEFARSIRLCLALNRLYLRAPADWLSSEQREQLEDMNRDGDFSLELSDSQNESLRLTHPHLSDAIYPHLLQAPSGIVFAQDLGAAFSKALSAGKESLALRLLLAFSPSDTGALAERMKRVDSVRLAKLCAEAWLKRVAGGDIRVQAGLTVAWTCWPVAHPALNKSADVLLSEALADMDAVEAQFSGNGWWAAWWMRLWRANEADPALVDWAVKRLKEEQVTGLSAWSHIWQLVFGLQLSCHRGDLAAAAQHWLERSGHRGDWHFVWHDLKTAGLLPDQQIIDLLTLVLPNTDAPHWAHVWQESLPMPPTTTSLKKLLGQGCEWLKGREDKDQWAFVWQVLLAREGDLPEGQTVQALVAQGCAWLKGREDKDQWKFVWEVLLARAGDLAEGMGWEELLRAGVDWVRRYASHPSSPAILKAALKHWGHMTLKTKADLGAVIAQWVPRCAEIEAGPAGHLIEAMIDAGLGGEAAIQHAAREWCERASNHPSWTLVLVKCLRCVTVWDGWDPLAQRLARQVANHPNAGWLHKAEQLLSVLRVEEATPGVAALLTEIRQRKLAPQWRQADRWLASGEAVAARISAVTSNRGAVVELPGGLYAVLQTRAASRYRREQSVDVRVVRVETFQDRVIVREAVVPAAMPSAGDIVMGKITGHQPYGVFVRVGNTTGLIHSGELPMDEFAWRRWLPLASEWSVKILRHTDKGFNAILVEPPWATA